MQTCKIDNSLPESTRTLPHVRRKRAAQAPDEPSLYFSGRPVPDNASVRRRGARGRALKEVADLAQLLALRVARTDDIGDRTGRDH